jgi:hypothetical protein
MAEPENPKSKSLADDARGGNEGSGANQSNPSGADDVAGRDFRDPHGNQTLRQPSGGDGSGESRGDASAFNPAPATGPGTNAPHDADPVEGSRDEWGTDDEGSGS